MLVSILTPSYNQGCFVGDCIASVANQTYRPIEHIICDGGSTDETLDVLHNVAEQVRWASEPDRGQSHALNKALALSQGEIIGWLNSDDAYADRRAVEAAVRAFERWPDVGVVYGHGLHISADNRLLQFLWAPPHREWLMDRLTPFVQPSVFIRRSVIPEPFVREDLRYVMDYDLWRRLRPATRFERIDAIVGVDRHQPMRKVLERGYIDEREAYARDERIERCSPATLKGLKVALRWSGIWSTTRLDLEPAFDLDVDSVRARVIRQVLVPRSRMTLAAAASAPPGEAS